MPFNSVLQETCGILILIYTDLYYLLVIEISRLFQGIYLLYAFIRYATFVHYTTACYTHEDTRLRDGQNNF